MKNYLKSNIKTELVPVLSLFIMAVASFKFYSLFPEKIPMHWNFEGQVDGYGSKWAGAFVIPIFSVCMYVLFFILPSLDPKKEKYEQFKKVYHIFKALIILFMALIYFMVGFSALGYQINISLWVPILVGLLFILLGNYFNKIKPNWFVGIKTPWTLSSDENWKKTHDFGGKVFILGGLLMMSAPLFPQNFQKWLLIIIVALILVGTIGYSLVYYLYEQKKK